MFFRISSGTLSIMLLAVLIVMFLGARSAGSEGCVAGLSKRILSTTVISVPVAVVIGSQPEGSSSHNKGTGHGESGVWLGGANGFPPPQSLMLVALLIFTILAAGHKSARYQLQDAGCHAAGDGQCYAADI